jgi:hypothetical protein
MTNHETVSGQIFGKKGGGKRRMEGWKSGRIEWKDGVVE